jgi:transcription antitermination factor NusG
MQICGANSQWYAVRTAGGREKAVASQLQSKGYEEFLPLYRSRRQWCDRVKELEMALFPGYLFCRFDFNHRLPILITPGVQMIVGTGKLPTPVSDAEIEALRRVIASGAPAEPHEYLAVGQRVRIREGSLAGIEGILAEAKNSWRMILSVELLRRSVAVEVDRAVLSPVGPPPAQTPHVFSPGAVRAGAETLKAAI